MKGSGEQEGKTWGVGDEVSGVTGQSIAWTGRLTETRAELEVSCRGPRRAVDGGAVVDAESWRSSRANLAVMEG